MAARTDLRLRLAPARHSVSRARTAVQTSLPEHIPADLRDTVGLLVSELVTNAILHVGAAVDVDVRVNRRGVIRVDVRDPSRYRPRRREAGTDTTGRGLVLVEALADRWGVDVTRGGKSVWFELDVPAIRA